MLVVDIAFWRYVDLFLSIFFFLYQQVARRVDDGSNDTEIVIVVYTLSLFLLCSKCLFE